MAEQQSVSYPEITEKYPWILEKDQNCVLSPDSDGFLCGLLFSHLLNWKIVGYYDGKISILKKGLRATDCIFLDLNIFRRDIRSVDHHMVLFNKNHVPQNWDNYANCIQLNNLRNFDQSKDFQRKYPFGTIHFLIGLFQSQDILTSVPEDAVWPLLFSDGVWNNLFGYTENCLDWLNYLGISDSSHILHPVFCGDKTVYEVMNGINALLRMRDSFNAVGYFDGATFVNRKSSRTGDKLRISNASGDPINLIQSNGTFDIHIAEKDRIEGFVRNLAQHTGWSYDSGNWGWAGFKVFRFTKKNLKPNISKFEALTNQNPLSFAITGGDRGVEYTLEEPDTLP